MIGRINFYSVNKGYDFITVTEAPKSPIDPPSQKQYFFHHSHFRSSETPAVGVYVVFGLAPAIAIEKKPQAVSIRYATAQEIASHIAQGGVA